jgi:ATP-dependent RNA helicase DDX51/DBP6
MLLPGNSQQPGDILVSAATGSGKTLAYVLPMIEDISRHIVTNLRGIIVMPTRELVLQAREVAEICAAASSGDGRKRVVIGTAVGSESFKAEQVSLMEQEDVYDPLGRNRQEERINLKWNTEDATNNDGGTLLTEESISRLADHVINYTSRVDILICTPGRLVEHIHATPGFTLDYVKWLVVDEADKLLGQAFQNWLGLVMKTLPDHKKSDDIAKSSWVRKLVLSATITRDVGQLSGLKLYRPKLVVLNAENKQEKLNLAGENVLPSLLVESAIKVEDENEKPLYLMDLLLRGSASECLRSNGSVKADESYGVLIFTNSNESAVRLARLIALLEPRLSDLIGTLTSTTRSSTRNSTIKSFNSSKLSILVASDLVSRGLDLPNLAHVINYDIPTSVTNYVHRVGRTARAGKRGEATTLYTNKEGRWFWIEIGRGESIARVDGAKVERKKVGDFEESARGAYEVALEQLGREAMEKPLEKKSRLKVD